MGTGSSVGANSGGGGASQGIAPNIPKKLSELQNDVPFATVPQLNAAAWSEQKTRDTVLTGLLTTTALPVAPTDNFLAAIGKLQAQISSGGANLTWTDYVTRWSATPAKVGTTAAGDVYSYTLSGVTRYRLVPTAYDPAQDAFYSTFTGGALSGFIVARDGGTGQAPPSNNNAPVFTSGASATVTEGVSAIYTAATTDADAGDTNVVYSLLSGVGDAALLAIDASTGVVSLASGLTDYETKTGYTFTVRATNTYAGTTLTTDQPVTVTVTDANDNAPVFTSGATGQINETAVAGDTIYTAITTDADGTAPNRTVAYSLKAGVGDASLLAINASTGVVTLLANANFATNPQYAFTVVATNGTLVTEQAVTITVNKVVVDPIRAVLVASGANAADLATYDALPVGGVMILTTNQTSQAFQQTVRANALLMTGAYRVNGADSLLDGAPDNLSSNQMAVNSTPASYKLNANSLPVFAFLNTGSGGVGGNFSMRRSQTAHLTTSLITAGTALDTDVFPAVAYPAATNRYHVFVQKLPTANVATIDTNVAGVMSGSIALLSGANNYIRAGVSTTTFSTSNAFQRQWQAVAVPIANYA